MFIPDIQFVCKLFLKNVNWQKVKLEMTINDVNQKKVNKCMLYSTAIENNLILTRIIVNILHILTNSNYANQSNT